MTTYSKTSSRISLKMLRKAPTDTAKRKIRKILYLPNSSKWPRCPAKNIITLREMEANGNFEHSDKKHICDECRCPNIAGAGTYEKWGDYYGTGEETGHYGIGYCAFHEQATRFRWSAARFADAHRKALQVYGMKQVEEKPYELIVQAEAEEAKYSMEIREGIISLKEYIDEFIDKMKQCDELQEYVSGGKGMGSVLSPMSDQTKAQLITKLLSTLSGLVKDRFFIEKDDMVHIDDIKIRIPRIINLGKSIIDIVHEDMKNGHIDLDAWKDKYVAGLKDILVSIRKAT